MTYLQGAGAGPFDSGLTTPDFVACLAMGLQPLGLVQGFYVGRIGQWSLTAASPVRQYRCLHYENHLNPGWVGVVQGLDEAWMSAHATALQRMTAEAAQMGAHGVVGVTTEMSRPTSAGSCQVHLYGTAVAVQGALPPQQPWSSQLAGHKLAKLVEIGFIPDSVAYVRSTAVMVEGCIMEYYNDNYLCGTGQIVEPIRDVQEIARSGAVSLAHRPGRSMYDVKMSVHESEHLGGVHVSCTLMGSFVRRHRNAATAAPPVATLSLS